MHTLGTYSQYHLGMDAPGLADHYGLDPAVLDGAPPGPITVVNLFKLREIATYPPDAAARTATSGLEAMLAYAAVSGDRLAAVGGRFLSQGLMVGSLWGDDGTGWDLVVVAEYPGIDALRALLDDELYRDAYEHRRAAVERQRVLVSTRIS
jgi:uncharacterized protein (DUF1330 family)